MNFKIVGGPSPRRSGFGHAGGVVPFAEGEWACLPAGRATAILKFVLSFLFYLDVKGKSAIKRARFMAVAKWRWCLAQR